MSITRWADRTGRLSAAPTLYLLLAGLLGLLVLSDRCSAQEATTLSPVETVLTHYRTGRIDRAELEALRLLNQPGEHTAAERSELHQVLAFIAVAREDPQLARDHFLQALRFNPDLNLDRGLTSPKILAVFDEARADFKRVQIRDMDLTQSAMQSTRLRLEGARRSLLLPGWGQFHKGNREHGYAFLGITTLVGTGLLFSQFQTVSLEGKYRDATDPDDAASTYESWREAWSTRNGLAIALGVVWVVNVFDALYYPPAGETEAGAQVQLGWDSLHSRPLIGVTIRF